MDTLVLLAANAQDFIIASSGSTGLANSIRDFIGPILLLVCGIAAITFLFQRQIMQFVIFLILAVVVLAIFYAPEFLRSLGSSLGESQSDLEWE